MPVALQNLACSMAGMRMKRQRYNNVFRDFLGFLEESDWWCLDLIQSYQEQQLSRVIQHAYDTVPYYKDVMDNLGVKPTDIRRTDDLAMLPILTKDTVRRIGSRLYSTSVPLRFRVAGHTGGTTGKALTLFSDRNTHSRQWAVWWRHRRRFGLNINDDFIVFAGRNVIPLSNMNPPFWRRNTPMHQTYVSIHHMTKQNMPALLEYLQKRKVKYYSGYPSAVYLVAKYMLDNGITLPNPPEVTVLGAETLLPHQRRAMKEAFGGRITDQYGASEQCGNISECEHGNYHVDMEFGHIEFLPLKEDIPNVRRIVCTGFWNDAMPLIRYETGDLATISSENFTCPCGRKSPVVEKIDGRIESYIITPDGRQAGRLDFIFKDSWFIEEAQFIQEDISSVKVKVVRSSEFKDEHEKKLLSDLRKYLGDVIRFEIEYVDAIPRTANGKFRQIISTVSSNRSN